MTILSDIERADSLISEDQMAQLIKPVDKLPEATEEQEGKAYILVHRELGRHLAHTYKCVRVGRGFDWKLINYREDGNLDNVTQLWANSVIHESDGTATVKLHWNDPEDKPDAHWAYSVIVKKLGADPTSPYDGEVVGYSTVRDQYAGKTGFIDTIDGNTITDEDIIDNGEHDDGTVIIDDKQYHYNVFAFTTFGHWTGANKCCGPTLTWEKFQELVREGIADHAVDLGDLIRVYHETFGFIDFEVVDFNHAVIVRDGIVLSDVPSVTFMSKDVLFRGSFTHIEDFDLSSRKTAIEKIQQFWDRNVWKTSNARAWLNSEEEADEVDYMGMPHSTSIQTEGAYGDKTTNTLFPGFLKGLPDDLKQVMSTVRVSTTLPRHNRWTDDQHPDPDVSSNYIDTTNDKVFLPSYYELFGRVNWPGDELIAEEGRSQFDIYRLSRTNTRMKEILYQYDTQPGTDWQTRADTHLVSWYLRTPMYSVDVEIGGDPIECIEIVTCKNRRYDANHELGEDGATGRTPYMPASSSVGDIARDKANNTFTPTGTRLNFTNNTAPGCVPCFVVA